MYEDIYDAKTAVEHLSGFNVANRYLIVLYYNTAKQNKKARVAPALLPCPALPWLCFRNAELKAGMCQ